MSVELSVIGDFEFVYGKGCEERRSDEFSHLKVDVFILFFS